MLNTRRDFLARGLLVAAVAQNTVSPSAPTEVDGASDGPNEMSEKTNLDESSDRTWGDEELGAYERAWFPPVPHAQTKQAAKDNDNDHKNSSSSSNNNGNSSNNSNSN